MEKAIDVLQHLLEGCSVRTTQRITEVDRETILALLVHVGANCKRMMEAKFIDVSVNDIQADEVWSFVGMKEKTRAAKDAGDFYGDAYTFVAIERTSKLIVAWHLGKRTVGHTYTFAQKLDRATAGLWFAFYNFGRVHMTLKTETPAMASGLQDHVWTIRELIEESAKF